MPDYSSLLIFLKQYNEHYKDFLKFEQKKMELVAKDDVQGLTESIKTEQALIMKTNAFETKRIKMLDDGSVKKTFSQIITEAPEEYKAELTDCFKELSKLVLDIKKVNDNVRLIVNERMKIYEISNDDLNLYTNHGAKNNKGDAPRTMMKSV